MRIGFDASPLAGGFSAGVARVAERTLAALEERGVLDVVRLNPPAGIRQARFRKQLPGLVKSEQLDGLHTFASLAPTGIRVPLIVTVHELPWKHGATENAGWKHKLTAWLAPRRAARVVAPTDFVARDLRAGAGKHAANVRVVGWGWAPPFDVEPPLGTVDEGVLERYRLSSEPFILCPGATRQKKRLDRVIAGLERFIAKGKGEASLGLVVTGPHTKDLERDLGRVSRAGLSRWVSTLGEVGDDDLAALTRLAACVPVLSDSEGFALPVLEALACGTPVIVPTNSAQAEVAGANGIVVDPDDADALAQAFVQARDNRERQRYQLAASVREQTWHRTAEQIEALWQELLG